MEGGKEGEEEDDEGRQVEEEVMKAVLAAAIRLERYERNTALKEVPPTNWPRNHFNMRVRIGTVRRRRTSRRTKVRWTDEAMGERDEKRNGGGSCKRRRYKVHKKSRWRRRI